MTCLETIANPYATVLGAPESGPTRINIAQTTNGVGWMLGPVVGGYFVFSGWRSECQRRPYHTIHGHRHFCRRAARCLCLSPVPDSARRMKAAVAPSERSALKPSSAQPATIAVVLAVVCGVLYFFIAPILGLIWTLLHMNESLVPAHEIRPCWSGHTSPGSFWSPEIGTCSVASTLRWALPLSFSMSPAQTGIFSFCVNYILENDPGVTRLQASKWLGAIGFGLFMVGRLCGSAVISQFKPEHVLTVYSAVNVALIAVAMGGGKVGLYAMFATFFFMSVGFPTIFALGIRGLGDYTKLASSLIVMAIVGGAIAAPFVGRIADVHSMRAGFVVPLVCFVLIALYGATWARFSRLDSLPTPR